MSRRRRAQTFRGGQYAVLVVVVLLLVVFADWATIRDAFFNTDAASDQFPGIFRDALLNTVVYTSLGFALGMAIGVAVALMKLSSIAPYRWLATIYVEFFRGIPALLVFITLGYGVPLAFGIRFDIYSTAAISLGLVGSAYIAETLRAGIQAVPPGQVEAARALGMSPGRTTVTVVIPQAFRIVLPPLTNELILLTKDSSLIYLLGLARGEYELAKFGREGLNATGSLTPILLAGLCYLIITIPLGYLSQYLERRSGRKDKPALEMAQR